MDFTISKDEICKYIAEIQGLPRISPRYIEDLMQYLKLRSEQSKSESQIDGKCNVEMQTVICFRK